MLKVLDRKRGIVGGVVLEPENKEDAETIEELMAEFMRKYMEGAGRFNVEGRGQRFPILESFQAQEDIEKGGVPIPPGSWFLAIKVDPETLRLVES